MISTTTTYVFEHTTADGWHIVGMFGAVIGIVAVAGAFGMWVIDKFEPKPRYSRPN